LGLKRTKIFLREGLDRRIGDLPVGQNQSVRLPSLAIP
jgi:hypothetical protein